MEIKSEKLVYIRVDANEIVASGHVMRCITIAKELRKRNVNVIFITADQGAVGYIAKEGFQSIVLNSIYHDLEKEIDECLDILIQRDAKIVLVDSYFVTEQYFNQLSQHVEVVYLDDLNKFNYPVRLLIHYGLHGDDDIYINNQSRDNKKILLGMQYIPLREEFSTAKIALKEVSDIILTTGGSDFNVKNLLLNKLLEYSEWCKVKIHVVCGALSTDFKILKNLEKDHSNIIIHANVTKMADLMKSCDIAVSAGGTTVYELIACGLPVVCFSMAENQTLFIKELAKRDYVKYVGDITQDKDRVTQAIISELTELKADYEKRKQLCDHCSGLVDGLGAKRIAAEIEQLLEGD